MAKQDKTSADGQMALADLIGQQDPAKLRALTRNLTQAVMESQELMAEFMGQTVANAIDLEHPVTFGTGQAMSQVGRSLVSHPERVVDANMSLWQGYAELWRDFMTGQTTPGASRDKRFADPEWTENPVFSFLRRSYELNARWMLSLIDEAKDISDQDRRKARFLAQQTADAFSPTNFFATNPTALRALIETGGESIVEGLRQAREDLRKGDGKLAITQVDESGFKVGGNLATAPGKVVFRNDLIELIQYSPTQAKAHEIPLVIFPPWINKFYILDLREENSMIRWLVDKGLTVFVVSWRSADLRTKDLTWDDYVRLGIFEGLEAALDEAGADQVNAIGYCIGGTLLSCALAYMAQTGDDRIRSATYFASQSDFEKAGDLLVFTDADAVEEIAHVIEHHGGIMPGELMGETFNWLRPVDLVWRYIVDNYMLGKKPKPFDLLYWNADQTNIPGQVHLTYLRELYARNALARGNFKVLGRTISMADIQIPVTVQCSRDDHICPAESVYRTAHLFGGPVRFIMAGSGHIAGVVNPPAAKKYQHWIKDGALPEALDDWMDGAEERPGSWWPTWWDWLEPLSGEKGPAIEPSDKGLGEAPGFYVTARLSEIAEATAAGKPYDPPAPRRPAAEPARPRKSGAAAEPAAPPASAPKAKAKTPARTGTTTKAKAKAKATSDAETSAQATKKTGAKGKSGASKAGASPSDGASRTAPTTKSGTSGKPRKSGAAATSGGKKKKAGGSGQ